MRCLALLACAVLLSAGGAFSTGVDHAYADAFSPTSGAPIVHSDDVLPNGSPYFRAAGSKWPHLNYDSPHFFCDNFVPLCEDILDQVACPVENRVSWACGSPTNASVPRTLNYYNASCYCTDPWIPADYTPARLTELLFDNRAKGTSAWHLLPWASTKFDVRASYAAFCYTALYRLGCSPSLMKINTTLSGTASWVCTCGQFTTGSKRAYVDLVDKLADLSLQELPVFEDPLYLSATLSVGIMVLLGKAGSVLASSLGLPPVVGFLLAGMGMQDIIYRELIKGSSIMAPKFFSEARTLALVIVLMRAGLTLKPRTVISKGAMTVLLSILPYFSEFGVMMGIGKALLVPSAARGTWTTTDIGLFVSILAALSPSLVIPAMLKFTDDSSGPGLGFTPQTVLNSAPIEVVLAIILYNVFASLELTTVSPFFPWVRVLPLWANCILIPVNIIFSTMLGAVAGYTLSLYYRFRANGAVHAKLEEVLPASASELLLVLLLSCYLLYALCTPQYIQQASGILVVFVVTMMVSEYAPLATVATLKTSLAHLWTFAEIFLFTSTGINLSLRAVNGPEQSMRGLSTSDTGTIIVILLIGQLGRAGGIAGAGACTWARQPQHRRNPAYFVRWWMNTWIFQMPKATLQATLGGLPYAFHIITGSDGLARTLYIQQATAFTVLFCATIGVVLTQLIGKRIATQLAEMDREAETGLAKRASGLDEVALADSVATDEEGLGHHRKEALAFEMKDNPLAASSNERLSRAEVDS